MTERLLLKALDPSTGGVASGSAERIASLLRDRGVVAEDAIVRGALDRMARAGKLERVVTEDGSAVYTRPDVLLRVPGVTSVHSRDSGR